VHRQTGRPVRLGDVLDRRSARLPICTARRARRKRVVIWMARMASAASSPHREPHGTWNGPRARRDRGAIHRHRGVHGHNGQFDCRPRLEHPRRERAASTKVTDVSMGGLRGLVHHSPCGTRGNVAGPCGCRGRRRGWQPGSPGLRMPQRAGLRLSGENARSRGQRAGEVARIAGRSRAEAGGFSLQLATDASRASWPVRRGGLAGCAGYCRKLMNLLQSASNGQ